MNIGNIGAGKFSVSFSFWAFDKCMVAALNDTIEEFQMSVFALLQSCMVKCQLMT